MKPVAMMTAVAALVCFLVPSSLKADETDTLSTSLLPALLTLMQADTTKYILPDTGVTKFYGSNTGEIVEPYDVEPYYGQDAQYNSTSQQMSYTDNGDGTVTDNLTGLMWMQADDGEKRIWDDAVTYCEDLALAGYSDWRLPSQHELFQIVDKGKSNPAINPVFTTNLSMYWTSDTYASLSVYAWYMCFYDGVTLYNSKRYHNGVRCVRSIQSYPEKKYEVNGSVVLDTITNLMWPQKETTSSRKDWEGALAYCEDLTLDGYSDWRLPNINELESLLDLTRETGIDPTFETPTGQYWSSTTSPVNPTSSLYPNKGYAYDLSFGSGQIWYFYKFSEFYVRCVRSGPLQ
ncbi:DUF1566 domain-containing protein [Desulfovibrio inopinatus]|uniref:Lcl C-terminal domain-containing protein n=1 Tax=Desulfovibrio inopinatus TaxID=102109 RepID=UPI000420BF38|nr:DUF1566 domain-containing protein [Desulfovibrio inopinatus]